MFLIYVIRSLPADPEKKNSIIIVSMYNNINDYSPRNASNSESDVILESM